MKHGTSGQTRHCFHRSLCLGSVLAALGSQGLATPGEAPGVGRGADGEQRHSSRHPGPRHTSERCGEGAARGGASSLLPALSQL